MTAPGSGVMSFFDGSATVRLSTPSGKAPRPRQSDRKAASTQKLAVAMQESDDPNSSPRLATRKSERTASTVAEGQFAASQLFDLDRLPEVFGGNPRDARHPHPGLYPAACSPQAWSAGAVILLVNIMLGLMPVAPRDTLVVDPVLPDWLPGLTVRNIRVGDRRAALRAWRDSEGTTQLDVLEAGGLVIVRPDPAILSAGQDRVAARVRLAHDPRSGHILSS